MSELPGFNAARSHNKPGAIVEVAQSLDGKTSIVMHSDDLQPGSESPQHTMLREMFLNTVELDIHDKGVARTVSMGKGLVETVEGEYMRRLLHDPTMPTDEDPAPAEGDSAPASHRLASIRDILPRGTATRDDTTSAKEHPFIRDALSKDSTVSEGRTPSPREIVRKSVGEFSGRVDSLMAAKHEGVDSTELRYRARKNLDWLNQKDNLELPEKLLQAFYIGARFEVHDDAASSEARDYLLDMFVDSDEQRTVRSIIDVLITRENRDASTDRQILDKWSVLRDTADAVGKDNPEQGLVLKAFNTGYLALRADRQITIAMAYQEIHETTDRMITMLEAEKKTA